MKRLRWGLGSVVGVGAVLAVSFVLAAAPPPAADSESASRLLTGPHSVATLDTHFVDTARPTRPNGDFPGSDVRRLEATLWFPESATGRLPLVIYSHGFMSSRGENADLAELLASHGYVVAAADFPLTHGAAPGGATISDVVHQPGDLRFLIDQVVEWANHASPFAGEIDLARIGAVGLSLGGLTTQLATFHPRLRDPRIRAAVSIAGPTEMFTRAFFANAEVPLLMIAGTADAIIPYAGNAAPLLRKAPSAELLSIEGASHAGFAIFADRFPLRLLANPDSLGCWAIANNLGTDPHDDAFLRELGSAEEGVAADPEQALPCAAGAPGDALKAGRQLMITRLAAVAFLQSHFAPDPGERATHATYLRETLTRDFPEASFASRPR